MWWELKCDFYCLYLSVFKILGKLNKVFYIYVLKVLCLRINIVIFFFKYEENNVVKIFLWCNYGEELFYILVNLIIVIWFKYVVVIWKFCRNLFYFKDFIFFEKRYYY